MFEQMKLVSTAIVVLATLLVLVTVLPFVPTNDWWIRIWDFPRIQVAALLGLVLLAFPLIHDRRKLRTWGVAACVAVALACQLVLIRPYTPLHPIEVTRTASCASDSIVQLLVANVLMTNRRAEPLLDHVRRLEPDVVLLLETDAWWDERLAPMRASYPFVVSRPRGDFYGLHLFSRLELVDAKVRYLIDDYVPSVRAGLRLRSGALIDFHGVHPRPPPHQDTARRDAELLITAREVREIGPPSIVAGDLNDVTWSRTTRLFQETGGLLDPRIGRGPYPTYNANWPLLRWPLDHVFFEREFGFSDLRVLGDIGSDHFPVYAALCHAPGLADRREPPRPEPEDLKAAAEAIREGREEARERP
jgi:endonuclease/exonuclease/phosphatase (EEP) superfamily protein YafD